MSRIIYKGKPLTGSGIEVRQMTRAEYERDKSALDLTNLMIEITDEDLEPINADDIGYGDGTVGDAITQINNDLSELIVYQSINANIDVPPQGYNFIDVSVPNGYDLMSVNTLSASLAIQATVNQFGDINRITFYNAYTATSRVSNILVYFFKTSK